MFESTTYDVICNDCKKVVWHGEIGEYPYSWQVYICSCGGYAVPDLEHPYINKHRTQDDQKTLPHLP